MTTARRARVPGSGRQRAGGFTLIEVIVALSLLAFGLALSFGTLRGASKATERAEVVAQRDEHLRAVQGFLRAQLAGALPVAFAFDSETGGASFLRASPNKLEFVGTMPGYLSRGGPYLQTLELVPGSNGRRLMFQLQLLATDGPLDAEREPVLLLDGIADGAFELRDLDEKSLPGDWQPEWNVSARLPPLVRLRIAFIDKGRHWPEFVVATRLSLASAGTAAEPSAGDEVTTQ